MTKQQTLDTLKSQLPGFYSAEQVIALIEGIEESATVPLGFTDEQRDELVNSIADEIADLGMDVVADYDLSMSYNEVEIDSIDFSTSTITCCPLNKSEQKPTSIFSFFNFFAISFACFTPLELKGKFSHPQRIFFFESTSP